MLGDSGCVWCVCGGGAVKVLGFVHGLAVARPFAAATPRLGAGLAAGAIAAGCLGGAVRWLSSCIMHDHVNGGAPCSHPSTRPPPPQTGKVIPHGAIG